MTDLFAEGVAALTGQGRRQDFAAARELFRRSGGTGRLDAAVVFGNFLAAGIGGPPDWEGGIRMLRALAEANPRSRRELAVVEQMALTPAGDPVEVPRGELVCASPHIIRFPALFSAEECRYLIEAARPMLEPSVVVDPATGRHVKDPVRTSDGMAFSWPLENPAIHALNRRIAAASGTAPEQGEPLQVLRYLPGEQFRTHYDAIPVLANQRVMTILVWLNEDYSGGETEFPAAKLKLKGSPGDAILFRNTGADGRRDPRAAHAGLPVTHGEKLIASRWIRQRRFEPPPIGGPVT